MIEQLQTFFATTGLKLFYALLVLLIGLKVIKHLDKYIAKKIEKSDLDVSIKSFTKSIADISLKIMLFVTTASMVGIKITAFAAVIGAFTFAVGMALQGSLSNFAGGVMILIFKPFIVGDFIEASGYSGTVKEITIFYTHLTTPDNKAVVIPNGNLSNSSLTNYSKHPQRRVDFTFGVGYESDIKKVKSVIESVVLNHKKILKDPEPFIRLGAHNDSSLDFIVRVWCNTEDYWSVYFDMMEEVKEAFDRENIEIPYPHMDVNVTKN